MGDGPRESPTNLRWPQLALQENRQMPPVPNYRQIGGNVGHGGGGGGRGKTAGGERVFCSTSMKVTLRTLGANLLSFSFIQRNIRIYARVPKSSYSCIKILIVDVVCYSQSFCTGCQLQGPRINQVFLEFRYKPQPAVTCLVIVYAVRKVTQSSCRARQRLGCGTEHRSATRDPDGGERTLVVICKSVTAAHLCLGATTAGSAGRCGGSPPDTAAHRGVT